MPQLPAYQQHNALAIQRHACSSTCSSKWHSACTLCLQEARGRWRCLGVAEPSRQGQHRRVLSHHKDTCIRLQHRGRVTQVKVLHGQHSITNGAAHTPTALECDYSQTKAALKRRIAALNASRQHTSTPQARAAYAGSRGKRSWQESRSPCHTSAIRPTRPNGFFAQPQGVLLAWLVQIHCCAAGGACVLDFMSHSSA